MKIAYILPSLSNKGPIKVVYELVKQLQSDHHIEIFYFSEYNELLFTVPTHHINFFDTIDFDKYDIIHSHGIRPDAYIFFHNNKIRHAKTVTTLHNYVKEDLRYQYNPLVAYIFSHVWNFVTSQHDRIITLSKHAKIYYQEFWYNKTIDYVYNGISKTLNMQALPTCQTIQISQLRKSNTILGAIGLLTLRKGFEQIIKALAYLPSHALLIVGDGTEKKSLKKLCSQYGVEDRVLFMGFTSNVPAILDLIDIMVVPSRSEGFSLVIQEAARQKKVVVCSDIPIFHELFTEDEVSFFTLDNIQMLANQISLATRNNIRLRENLNKRFLTTYNSVHMAQNYLKQYQQLLEEK